MTPVAHAPYDLDPACAFVGEWKVLCIPASSEVAPSSFPARAMGGNWGGEGQFAGILEPVIEIVWMIVKRRMGDSQATAISASSSGS